MTGPALPTDITARLAAFMARLRAEGLPVTTGTSLDAARALERIDPVDRAAFHATLRACATTSVDDYPLFEAIFRAYWDAPSQRLPGNLSMRPIDTVRPPPQTEVLARHRISAFSDEGDESKLPGGEGSASDEEVLTHKDFADLDLAELHRAQRLARRIAPSLATLPSRRTAPATAGHIDLRRTLREARRHGEIIDLARRRPRRRKLRVVALLDVSGSMDRYSGVMLQFLHALQGESSGVSVFAFSTRLHDITALLRRKRIGDALDAIARTVPTWSGGTSIGESLATFNRRHGARLLTPRTVIIIVSDGWERGDTDILAREMAEIRRRVRRIIWLNPLAGRQGYQPLARGMAAALPHVDIFLPANTLAALERLRVTLERLE